MQTYAITHDGEPWGEFQGATPEAALLACLHDAEPTRPRTVELLSTSPTYGQASSGNGDLLWGRGGTDTSRLWYVTAPGEYGVFAVADAVEAA